MKRVFLPIAFNWPGGCANSVLVQSLWGLFFKRQILLPYIIEVLDVMAFVIYGLMMRSKIRTFCRVFGTVFLL